jgi:hypothetical protein
MVVRKLISEGVPATGGPRGGKRKTERDSTIIEKKYKRRRETVDPHNRVRKYVE